MQVTQPTLSKALLADGQGEQPQVSAEDRQVVYDLLLEYNHDKNALVHMLTVLQDQHGYLPQVLLEIFSQELAVPLSKIYGIVTFANRFKLEKQGKYIVTCCQGTACFVKGGKGILDKLKEEMGIEIDETSADHLFTLNTVRCVSDCGNAPVVVVNKENHRKQTNDSVKALIDGFKNA